MRFLQCFAFVCCLCFLSITNASSQEIKVGDKVEFSKSGRTFTGEVVALVAGGKYVRIKYTPGGNEEVAILPASKAKMVNGAKQPSLGSNEFRKWKDQSGKFEISAQLVSKTKTHVNLKKRDGTTVEVPIERLSEADKKFLSDAEKNAPEVIGLIETDTNALKTVEVNGSELWNVQPDPVPSVAEGVSEFPVPYTDNRYRRFIFTHDRKMMYIGADRTEGFDLCLIDMATGKASWTGRSIDALAQRRCPWAVSPDPQLVVYAGPGSLFFAHLKKSGLIKGIAQWKPFKKVGTGVTTGIPLVAFVGTDHILTASSNYGTAVLWEWKNAKAVWRADFTPGIAPALSHNSKYLAIHSKNQLCFLDAKSGEVIGRVKCADRGQDQMAFSPDGKLLAVTGSRLGRVYDLTTGKKLSELSAHNGRGERGLYKHPVWVNNQTLHYKANFDVKTGMRYTESFHPFDGESLLGGTEYIRVMTGIGKTQKAVRRDLDELVNSSEIQDRGYVLAPSHSVSLDFRSQGLTNEQHEALRLSLVSQLTSNGIKVVNGSSKKIAIRLTCKMHSSDKTMESGSFKIQGGRVLVASQIMRFDNREFILNNSGLYVNKAFYDIATMDKTIKKQLQLDKARNQLRDDWVPNIILSTNVPLEPGKSSNRPPPITF